MYVKLAPHFPASIPARVDARECGINLLHCHPLLVSKVAFVGAKPNTGNKLALDCTTQQEAGEGSEVAQKKKKDTAEGPVCPVQGVMAGAGGLLDVPLHHDEEERFGPLQN